MSCAWTAATMLHKVMTVHCTFAGLKHRDERLLGAGSEVKTSASPFAADVDEEEEDPQVLFDKVRYTYPPLVKATMKLNTLLDHLCYYQMLFL